eukprot:m.198511 g.198511  ORF g.198511 m.198511 type:complete len:432 (-) comp32697_c0_seq4:53-1348(-)
MCNSNRGSAKGASNANTPQSWICEKCTLQNLPGMSVCGVCDHPKAGAKPPPPWTCLSCSLTNNGAVRNCTVCSMPKPKDMCVFKQPISPQRIEDCDGAVAMKILTTMKDIHTENPSTADKPHALSTSTFVIPSAIMQGSERMREFCLQEVGDSHARMKFEMVGILNWHPKITLIPLSTTGDGNCLLHSCSLSMWGVHDRFGVLRSLIARSLTQDNAREVYYPRWHTEAVDQQLALPAEFRVIREFEQEWKTVVELPQLMADTTVSNKRVGIFGCSLQGIHVYVLAQILRRAIVVYGYEDLDSRESGDSLTGIFLPTQWSAAQCSKTPLAIGSMMGHFFSLVPAGGQSTHIPLCKKDGTPFKLRYARTSLQEPIDRDVLINEYMNVEKNPVESVAVGARIDQNAESVNADVLRLVTTYITQATNRFNFQESS